MKKAVKPNMKNTKKSEISLDGFVFHTMPKEFIGAAVSSPNASGQQEVEQMKKQIVAEKEKLAEQTQAFEQQKAAQLAQQQKQAMDQKTQMSPKGMPKKTHHIPALIVLFFLILLLSGSVLAFFILRGTQSPGPTVVETTPEAPEEVVVEEPQEVVTIPQGSLDTDSDGLTDVEEKLYKTDIHNSDTDGDTYLDGNEVFHVFDPLSMAPSSLRETSLVTLEKVIKADGSEYQFVYPSSWQKQEMLEKIVVEEVREDLAEEVEVEVQETIPAEIPAEEASAEAKDRGEGSLESEEIPLEEQEQGPEGETSTETVGEVNTTEEVITAEEVGTESVVAMAVSTDLYDSRFMIRSGEFIEVHVYALSNTMSFNDWYTKTYGERPVGFSQGKTKEGFTAYTSQGGLQTYILFEDHVVEYTYDIGELLTIDYLQTFKMMINSFK